MAERSHAQKEASRKNGTKSKGPTSAGGKRRSSMNSLKHGCLSRTVILDSTQGGESQEDFDRLIQDYMDYWKPIGVQEEELVIEIVTSNWRKRRAVLAERGQIKNQMAQQRWTTIAKGSGRNGKNIFSKACEELSETGKLYGDIDRMLDDQSSLKSIQTQLQTTGSLTEKEEVEALGIISRASSLYDYGELRRLRPEVEDAVSTLCKSEDIAELIDAQLLVLATLQDLGEKILVDLESGLIDAAAVPYPAVSANLLRYEAALDNRIYKAMSALQILQERRAKTVPTLPSWVEKDSAKVIAASGSTA